MTREEMINELVENDLNSIRDNSNATEWIESVLRGGFKGYQKQTIEEIETEYKERLETE